MGSTASEFAPETTDKLKKILSCFSLEGLQFRDLGDTYLARLLDVGAETGTDRLPSSRAIDKAQNRPERSPDMSCLFNMLRELWDGLTSTDKQYWKEKEVKQKNLYKQEIKIRKLRRTQTDL
ncbi:hypothetical protein DdX_11216 [Ditylenchus destructor]|uniref:Uncharacterized protein n=1 Tax=Ditylenchus destructor TaxID=166010 RepID=A0AAD4R1C5_9BILA|nr:hypothetical protein DdX_11216 [Ditylenchus destructor]